MAESNDNWECIGKVNFFWYGYRTAMKFALSGESLRKKY